MKVGEFLLSNGLISQDQLDEALLLQGDNPDRVIGEILVTMGVFSKEELIMVMELYMVSTGFDLAVIDEWLDQDEIDLIAEKIKK
ncbi:MAG: hypothetical protein PF637_04690 [Spirochaetes bacterium]|nr:hypothetical protein [Spirochaetota bacterium]